MSDYKTMNDQEWRKEIRTVIGVDPGTTQSGIVTLERDGRVGVAQNIDNNEVMALLANTADIHRPGTTFLAVEWIENMGMQMGQSTIRTVWWVGRFFQVWQPYPVIEVPRREVKLKICGDSRAKDPNVRAALMGLYGEDPKAVVGTRKAPGPLYEVKSHAWSALGVAAAAWMGIVGDQWRPQLDDEEAA